MTCARLRALTASRGWPCSSPVRERTSTKTQVPPSSATRSSSPCGRRQLRATRRKPRRSSRAAARSSARAPRALTALLQVLAGADALGLVAGGGGLQAAALIHHEVAAKAELLAAQRADLESDPTDE